MSARRVTFPGKGVRAPGTPRCSLPLARLTRLYLGLACFGVSLALMVRARLGLGPWDVLHQGIARHLGVQLGWVTIGVSGLVLLAWIPDRKSTRLNSSHVKISYAVFCLKK